MIEASQQQLAWIFTDHTSTESLESGEACARAHEVVRASADGVHDVLVVRSDGTVESVVRKALVF